MTSVKKYYTKYSYMLAKYLKNAIETLVISNLINKLENYSNEELKYINGKEYHFYCSKEMIYSEELFVSKKVYNNAIKSLEEKKMLTTFSGKNPNNKLLNITYFRLNLDLISSILNEDNDLSDKSSSNEKELIKEPKKQVKTNPINEELKQLELDYSKGFISEKTYLIKKQRINNKNK